LQPYAWELPFESFDVANRMPVLSERLLHMLFSRDFAAQIAEQSRMIEGRGGGPWVQQFVDTRPYVTMTLEMVRWSFGWPLGLVCVGGLLYAIARNIFKPAAADLLLLSYAAITFLILGNFKASFPRYTLPIVAIACIFGARAIVSLGAPGGVRFHRLRAIAVAVLIASGLVYCTAYLRVYHEPHAWTSASLWILKNVPLQRSDGQPTSIAHEEWDDEIPLALSPDQRRYGSVRMAPYHGDGEEKAARLGHDLAAADWICLPTPRLYNTILKVADRYPVTAAYYRLLFAGELGFTLRTTVYQPPQLGPIRFVDLTADESHYVYDHPKAVIFEKTEPLPAGELARRIVMESARPARSSRTEILSAREAPREQLENLWRDPYAGDAVFTAQELAARIAQLAWLNAEDRQRFLAGIDGLDTRRAVETAAVRAVVASAREASPTGGDIPRALASRRRPRPDRRRAP
jgi:hypothetical protein